MTKKNGHMAKKILFSLTGAFIQRLGRIVCQFNYQIATCLNSPQKSNFHKQLYFSQIRG